MCRVTERYPGGSEVTFEGRKVGENGTVVLETKDGVKEIPKSRIVKVEETKISESKSPHEA